jgi:hypothetical protein
MLMGIRFAPQSQWIGLACLAACFFTATVHAAPSVNLECVLNTVLKGDTQAPGTDQPTCGQMYSQHDGAVVVTLQDGTALVAGGFTTAIGQYGGITTVAEIYQPRTGTFSRVGAMPITPQIPQYVLLGNGQVLVADDGEGGSAIYMPGQYKFAQVGSLIGQFTDFTLTAFGSSSALVAGGNTNAVALTQAQVYNAGSKTYTATGSLHQGRFWHRAVELANGRVLVVGGLVPDGTGHFVPTTSAEIYDPATGKFSSAGNMITARARPYVIRLPSGKVLIAGGDNPVAQPYQEFAAAELYDPATGIFSATGPMTGPGCCGQPFLLKSGKAMLGGEVYDPATGTFSGSSGQSLLDGGFAVLHTGQVLMPAFILDSVQAYTYQPQQ